MYCPVSVNVYLKLLTHIFYVMAYLEQTLKAIKGETVEKMVDNGVEIITQYSSELLIG